MSIAAAIVTESGFGKSTGLGSISKEDLKSDVGIEGVNPKETLLINIKDKPLPFRGWEKDYIPITLTKPPTTENYLASTDPQFIQKTMLYFSQNRLDIKNVVIDDFQYLMAEEFVANALKIGYEKFSKLAKNAYDTINTGLKLRKDIVFLVLTHSEETKLSYKIKTIGKMLDEKITLEGLFPILLYGKSSFDNNTKKVTKEFVTNFDGVYPAKSPVGMFQKLYIPNDLGLVVKTINEYYK